MRLPDFTAEASLYKADGAYRTAGHYYMSGTSMQDRSGVHPAAQDYCPASCIRDCEKACHADGNSQGFCATLCNSDCNAYTSGRPLSCGPCVDNVQTCTYCGGVTSTTSCGLLTCGNETCSPGAQCCGPHCCPPTCCPENTQCCSDGHDCCPDGQLCGSFLGWYFCIPTLGLLSSKLTDQNFSPRVAFSTAVR